MNNETMTTKEYVPFAVEIQVSNFSKSLEFYKDLLEFKVIRLDKNNKFATLSFNNSIFMIKEIPNLKQRGIGVELRFILNKDFKKYFDELKSKRVNIIKPIETMSYGLTRFYVKDPDGFELKLGTKSL